MNSAEIRATIIEIASLELPDLNLDGDFISSLDSVQRLTLVVALEDHFEICFDPENEAGLINLNDVTHHIHTQLKDQ